VRIIAGSAGGRRLAVPSGATTRPTTDRVREALFSALASWAGTGGEPAEKALTGLAFCDLYSGSGGVGLEAASRGAGPVLLVEADRRIAALAARNAEDLELHAEVRTARVEDLVSRPAPAAFDIVFADPPYNLAGDQVRSILSALVAGGWLSRDGLAVVERSRRAPALVWPDSLAQTWSRRYGEAVLEFGVADSLPAAEGAL
jgi:16S rRNA (guanine966-N2)-methyltransferase